MRSLVSGQNHAMRRAGLSRSVGRTVGAGELRDRFQGALLGTSLVPTALVSGRLSELLVARSLLQQALDCSLAQTRSFVSAPNAWSIDLVCLPSPAFLLPACVPVLLRYHDSWRRRFDRLVPLQLQIDCLERDAVAGDWNGAIAQILMLGDLLEAMSLNASQLALQADWIAWLTDCAERYQIAPQIHIQYEGLLSAIKASAGYSADEIQRSFVVGVTSALTHLESYVLAIQCLSGYSSNQAAGLGNAAQSDVQMAAQATNAIAFDWTAAFVAGLLSGAFSGGSGLPALWQIRPGIEGSRELANELFSLWAGGLSTAGLPS